MGTKLLPQYSTFYDMCTHHGCSESLRRDGVYEVCGPGPKHSESGPSQNLGRDRLELKDECSWKMMVGQEGMEGDGVTWSD